MVKYNGYPNWTQWNVALWINNDEGLYMLAKDCVRHTKTRDAAARVMLEQLRDCGITKTPDGARYTITSIRHAMVEM